MLPGPGGGGGAESREGRVCRVAPVSGPRRSLGKPERGAALQPASRRQGQLGVGWGGRLSLHWDPSAEARGGRLGSAPPTPSGCHRCPRGPSGFLRAEAQSAAGAWGWYPSKHLLTLLFCRLSLPSRDLLLTPQIFLEDPARRKWEQPLLLLLVHFPPASAVPKSVLQLQRQFGLGHRDSWSWREPACELPAAVGFAPSALESPWVRGATLGGLHCS